MGLRLFDLALFALSLYLVHGALAAMPWEEWLRGNKGGEAAVNLLRGLLTWSLGLVFFRFVLMPSITLVMGPLGELIRPLLR